MQETIDTMDFESVMVPPTRFLKECRSRTRECACVQDSKVTGSLKSCQCPPFHEKCRSNVDSSRAQYNRHIGHVVEEDRKLAPLDKIMLEKVDTEIFALETSCCDSAELNEALETIKN